MTAMLDRFTLHQPDSVAAASQLLEHFGEDAAIYAGGTELLVVLKERLAHFPHLIDIKRISGLREIAVDEASNRLVIGALATHRDIERSPLVRDCLPALASLAAQVANVRVRNMGTIGGNLCFAEPHSDPAALLTALDASLTLTSATASRQVPVADFFTGVMGTIRRHDELLTGLSIPLPGETTGVAYERFKLHERPTAAVAATVTVEEGRIVDARIVAGSVGERPQRLIETESALRGEREVDGISAVAGRLIQDEVIVTPDAFETEAYKRQLARTVGQRAVAAAIERSVDLQGGRHAA
jgi:aerobic carbon-monoxide dehydrogenase medium subunit